MKPAISKKPKESLKDRLKGFFGRTQDAFDEKHDEKVLSHAPILREDLLKNICAESELYLRVQALRELELTVQQNLLEQYALETILMCVEDLFTDLAPVEGRVAAFRLVLSLVEHQNAYLDTSKAVIFGYLQESSPSLQLDLKLDILRNLSQDGKDINHFEADIGSVLLEWLPYSVQENIAEKLLTFLGDVVRFNAATFDESLLRQLTSSVCIFACHTKESEQASLALTILETTLCYSCFSSDFLLVVVTTLCKLVNTESLCQKCWKLMSDLLKTHLGHSTVYTMCSILQASETYPDDRVLRGCVFFLGMSLWGAQRVRGLKHSVTSILPSLHEALRNSNNNPLVAYEVALSLQRLVTKYGKGLQLVTWDLVMVCLERLLSLAETQKNACDSELLARLNEILTVLETYYEANCFNGSAEQLFQLVEYSAKHRPESSIARLLVYKAQGIGPTKLQWLGTLRTLMDTYLKHDARSSIRQKALTVLCNVYAEYKYLYGDQIVETVVIPACCTLDKEQDPEVHNAIVDLLVDVAKDCQSNLFYDIVRIFEAAVNTKYENFDFTKHEEDNNQYFSFLQIAVCGLIEILDHKWNTSQSAHVVRLYELLTTHGLLQYSRLIKNSTLGWQTRKMILVWLLRLRVDGKLRVTHLQSDGKYACNYYLICQYESRYSVGSDSPPMSPTLAPLPQVMASTSSLSSPLKFTDFTLKSGLQMLTACIQRERSWAVLKVVLQELPSLLIARKLVLTDPDELAHLATALVLMVNDDGRAGGLLSGTADRIISSELNNYANPLLSALVSYHQYFEDPLKRKLAMAILSGLVSQHSINCVLATQVCLFELRNVITPMVRDLVRRLSEIAVTPVIAIPVLELMLTLVREPELYAGFTEKDYRTLFELLLPYINPFKFTMFIVAISYRALLAWFVRTPIAVRPAMAKIILNNLDAIKMPDSQLNEKSMLCLAKLHDEAKEVCIYFLSLYTFSNARLPDERNCPWLEPFIEGSIKQHWLIGGRLVSIRCVEPPKQPCTVCGSGRRIMNIASVASAGLSSGSRKISDPGHSTMMDSRRRHQSAFQRRVTIALPAEPKSRDDSFINEHSQSDTGLGELDTNTSVNSLEQGGSEIGSAFADTESIGESSVSVTEDKWPFVCSCMFAGWAEVVVRHPWGNNCWSLQVPHMQSIMDQAIIHDVEALPPELSMAPLKRAGDGGGVPASVDAVQSDLPEASRLFRHNSLTHDPRLMRSHRQSAPEAQKLVGVQGSTGDVNVDEYRLLDHAASTGSLLPGSMTTSLHSTKSEVRASSSSIARGPMSPVGVQDLVAESRMDPKALFLQLFTDPPKSSNRGPFLLPQNEAVERSIKNLDRVTPYETRKVGVVYVGPDQQTEVEILNNRSCSLRCQRFIDGLGEAICLTDNLDPSRVHIGGLDTTGRDGKFTYIWSDQITQMVFHVATLMPTKSTDPECKGKKLHIGNDYVMIVYNESGQEYRLGTLSGQFAYVAIVVEPVDADNVCISVKTKDEISRWLALKQAVVSNESAPALCRHMALRAELSAKVWMDQEQSSNEPFLSQAVERLRQIYRMHDKFGCRDVTVSTFLSYS